jgi:hypothetical protein
MADGQKLKLHIRLQAQNLRTNNNNFQTICNQTVIMTVLMGPGNLKLLGRTDLYRTINLKCLLCTSRHFWYN